MGSGVMYRKDITPFLFENLNSYIHSDIVWCRDRLFDIYSILIKVAEKKTAPNYSGLFLVAGEGLEPPAFGL